MRKAVKVSMKERTLPSGKVQIYFEYSDKFGKRVRKSSGLFLDGSGSRGAKRANDEQRSIAEVMRRELEDSLSNRVGEYHGKIYIYDYMLELSGRYTGNTKALWERAAYFLDRFLDGRKVTIDSFDRDMLAGFRRFLLGKECAEYTKGEDGMKQSSAFVYFSKLRCVLNTAFNDGLIGENPCAKVSPIKVPESERVFLTEQELQLIIDNYNPGDRVMRAFIFSCMTGLRRSDVASLRWKDIVSIDGTNYIAFTQKKSRRTGKLTHIWLNDLAEKMMGEPGEDKDAFVFGKINSSVAIDKLNRLAEKVGIAKYLTFHTARHTFATMVLRKTHDLYLTSKLLGHSKIETTTIYSHLIDEDKKNAIDSIGDIFK